MQPFFPLEQIAQYHLRNLANNMEKAAFVVADLSFERPSCYFELGFAEAHARTILAIAATGTRIHQIGQEQQVVFFDDLNDYQAIISKFISENIGMDFD